VILFDTSVLSRVFRRRRSGPEERRLQAVFDELMAADVPVGLPGIVLQEVLSGIRSHRQFNDLAAKLLAAFTVVAEGAPEHLEAARVKSACLGKGLNVSGVDCLIAACAISGNHELFAVDEDFEAIAKHAPLRLFREDAAGETSVVGSRSIKDASGSNASQHEQKGAGRMGDKGGKKDKDKGQKQKATRHEQEAQKKQEKQHKSTP
jgi:predicted nucleic acid-binding protein